MTQYWHLWWWKLGETCWNILKTKLLWTWGEDAKMIYNMNQNPTWSEINWKGQIHPKINIQSSSPQLSADGKFEVKFRCPQNISGASRQNGSWSRRRLGLKRTNKKHKMEPYSLCGVIYVSRSPEIPNWCEKKRYLHPWRAVRLVLLA